jgi:hypothetical protein
MASEIYIFCILGIKTYFKLIIKDYYYYYYYYYYYKLAVLGRDQIIYIVHSNCECLAVRYKCIIVIPELIQTKYLYLHMELQ